MDPELKAIKAIIDALEPLDAATRYRVLRWVEDRYAEPVIRMPGDITRAEAEELAR